MLLPENIALFVASRKRFVSRPKWDYDSDSRYAVFTVPLFTELPLQRFEVRAKVSKYHIARDALVQLEYAQGKRDREELERIQWRPFETHTNKAWGPKGYEFTRFERKSHRHTFEHNFLADQHRMRTGSLPAAVPIEPDPDTLTAFFEFCGVCLNIENINWVEMPQLTSDLFWTPS